MSIIAAKTWLPPELTTVQPYSMGPLLCRPGRGCAGMWAAPAAGTCVGMDRPELMISSVFVAPMHVQRAARKAGQRGIIMTYPVGLLEALGMVQEPEEIAPAPSPADRALGVDAAASFVEALAALEDED